MPHEHQSLGLVVVLWDCFVGFVFFVCPCLFIFLHDSLIS